MPNDAMAWQAVHCVVARMAVDGARALMAIDSLLSQGLVAQASALAESAVKAGTDRMAIYFRLVVMRLKQGRFREAAGLMPAAAALWPAEPAELVELGKRLAYFNMGEAMRVFAQRLLSRDIWHAAAEADFAAMLSMAGEQELASRLFERACQRDGLSAGRLYVRSQMHLYAGRLPEAEADLRMCLKHAPEMARAWWALSKLTHVRVDDAELASLQKLASSLPAGAADVVFLRFAQFNQLDRLGRTDEAWSCLELGCQAKRRQLEYKAEASDRYVDRLIAEMGPLSGPAEPVQAGLTPVFIVGMHRSGTTLLERILGSHSRVAEGGELYDFPAELRLATNGHFTGASDARVLDHAADMDFAGIGRAYLERVQWRAGGKRFLVDKLPSNFLNIGYLHRALPQAKILHMRRNAMDTCFSNLKELFSNACAYSYDQGELAGYFSQYRRLMRHWGNACPGFVLDVSYEALIADPETQARRVLDFCGLEWQPECVDTRGNTRTVNTASSAQVREPIHQRNVEAWRRYADYLEPMRCRLRDTGELD